MKKLFLLAVLAGLCWAATRRVNAADATAYGRNDAVEKAPHPGPLRAGPFGGIGR